MSDKPVEIIDGKVILHFGSGRILIARCDNGNGDFVGIGEYEGKQFPIDIKIEEVKGKTWNDWAVAMYFDKQESIDSMIHTLEEFKDSKFSSPTPTTRDYDAEAMKSLRLKFTSANSVPVTRSAITREEYNEIEAVLLRLQDENTELISTGNTLAKEKVELERKMWQTLEEMKQVRLNCESELTSLRKKINDARHAVMDRDYQRAWNALYLPPQSPTSENS